MRSMMSPPAAVAPAGRMARSSASSAAGEGTPFSAYGWRGASVASGWPRLRRIASDAPRGCERSKASPRMPVAATSDAARDSESRFASPETVRSSALTCPPTASSFGASVSTRIFTWSSFGARVSTRVASESAFAETVPMAEGSAPAAVSTDPRRALICSTSLLASGTGMTTGAVVLPAARSESAASALVRSPASFERPEAIFVISSRRAFSRCSPAASAASALERRSINATGISPTAPLRGACSSAARRDSSAGAGRCAGAIRPLIFAAPKPPNAPAMSPSSA